MPKKRKTTIENRVFLFDTMAETLLAGDAGELLVSTRPGDRARVLRALADLAHVSCVVADTADLDADGVRARLLEDVEPPQTGDTSVRGRSRG